MKTIKDNKDVLQILIGTVGFLMVRRQFRLSRKIESAKNYYELTDKCQQVIKEANFLVIFLNKTKYSVFMHNYIDSEHFSNFTKDGWNDVINKAEKKLMESEATNSHFKRDKTLLKDMKNFFNRPINSACSRINIDEIAGTYLIYENVSDIESSEIISCMGKKWDSKKEPKSDFYVEKLNIYFDIKISNILNGLEEIAVSINSGFVEEEANSKIFYIFHNAFLSFVKTLYYYICVTNTKKGCDFYKETIDLYHSWWSKHKEEEKESKKIKDFRIHYFDLFGT